MNLLRTSIVALALLAGVSACAGDPATRATAALAIACDSIATGLEQAAPLRAAGKLSADKVTAITRIRDAASPFCGRTAIVDPATAVAFVQASAAQISTLLGK